MTCKYYSKYLRPRQIVSKNNISDDIDRSQKKYHGLYIHKQNEQLMQNNLVPVLMIMTIIGLKRMIRKD
jgi:hypothetical protein